MIDAHYSATEGGSTEPVSRSTLTHTHASHTPIPTNTHTHICRKNRESPRHKFYCIGSISQCNIEWLILITFKPVIFTYSHGTSLINHYKNENENLDISLFWFLVGEVNDFKYLLLARHWDWLTRNTWNQPITFMWINCINQNQLYQPKINYINRPLYNGHQWEPTFCLL